MKKRLSAIWFTVVLTALTAGACGNAGNLKSGQNAADDSNAGTESYDVQMDSAGMEDQQTMDGGSADALSSVPDMNSEELVPEEGGIAASEAESASAAETVKNQKQKLIYTYHYSVETKAFDDFYQKVNQKVTQLEGYIEHSETNGSATDGVNRQASLTLRIPADQMEQMLTLLDSDSNVTYQSRSSENVTLQYVDMESHLKALRTEQETLLQLMEKADKLKDVIALQSQLTQVRYEIESYESQLRTYDNLVNYSTLYLNITEVDRTTTITSSKTSFLDEIGNRFSDNVYALGQWLRAMAVWLVGSLPILVPLAAIGVAAVIIIRKKFWHRKPKTNSQNTDTNSQGS